MFDNGFYGVIWCSRISMVLTVVRIAHGRFRLFLKFCVGGILVTWSVLFAQVFWTCEREPGWKNEPTPQCQLGQDVAIAQIVTDCIVDLLLIICPTYLLSSMKHRRGLKIRPMAIFSSTILVTTFSLVHSYMILKGLGKMEFMFAVFEVDVMSLIVVNLTVIATWLFKLSDEDQGHNGPSTHMNTFLKGRLSRSNNPSAANNHETMTSMVVLTQIETRAITLCQSCKSS
uniref:Rhodopsin domain-containing protein n=1 Tax=Moniliophthora roreri TaxID=221103 RepID=A0A0W0FBZ0_MONRR